MTAAGVSATGDLASVFGSAASKSESTNTDTSARVVSEPTRTKIGHSGAPGVAAAAAGTSAATADTVTPSAHPSDSVAQAGRHGSGAQNPHASGMRLPSCSRS